MRGQETQAQARARLQREAERQRRARIAENKRMAEEFFSGPTVTPTAPGDRRRELAGVRVSDTAYQLHGYLCGLSEAREYSDGELASSVTRLRPWSVEQVAAAVEELRAAELLAVEERAGGRFLNPHTPRYMLD